MSPDPSRENRNGTGPRLSHQQSLSLEVRSASVSLSAGAGCGKTTVLTERFLLSLEETGLRSLVALTFTDKAARELRKRIRRQCHARLRRGGEDAALWRSALRGLEAAPISTFHEYCAGLLRRHALRAGVDPDFAILDAAIADTILQEALARRLRLWLAEKDDDLIELASEYGLARVRESIRGLVRSRSASELGRWASLTPQEVVQTWQGVWDARVRLALYSPVEQSTSRALRWLQQQDFGADRLEKYRRELIAWLVLAEIEQGYDGLRDLRERCKMPGGKKDAWPSLDIHGECSNLLKRIRDSLDDYLGNAEPDLAASERAAALGLRFARLAAAAKGDYERAKRAHGGLDFDDLLVLTRDLLRADGLTEPVDAAQGVELVLVDEFQDTDPIQAEILRRLAGEGFRDGRLFVVGDFKQSIYRFRGAEPRIFSEFREEFPVEGQLHLTENYRSVSGIIDFVNALFTGSFPDEDQPLLAGPSAEPAAPGPCVELLWADEPPEDPVPKGPSVGVRRETEARWIARHLKQRLEAGWLIRDRRTGKPRDAGPGDVALLFRAMSDVALYEQSLEAEGFEYYVVGGRAFYAQQEVRDLINVLSVIEDPFDSLALTGALRGPFFALSDQAIYWLSDEGRADLADGLDACEANPGLGPEQPKAKRARDLLQRWRALKDRLPIAGLLDRVLDESGFEAALLGESLGGRKRANARKLVRLARRFDARGGFTLADFVARLRADLKETPREEQAATTDEEGESVLLMTIHQAKGLEFPIVVVPDLNRKSNLRTDTVVLHPELGPLVKAPEELATGDTADTPDGSGKSMGRLAYETFEKVEDENESLRLFYVSTTRARDALILSAGMPADGKPESAALKLLADRFDRATGAFIEELPAGLNLPVVSVVSEPPQQTPEASRNARRRRPAAALAVRAIQRTAVAASPSRANETDMPRFVDLDALRGLSPRCQRLDRLIRAVLAEHEGDPTVAPSLELVSRVGRRQDPCASADLVAEAVTLLSRLVVSTTEADWAGLADSKRQADWTVIWTWPDRSTTVFRGTTEFFLPVTGGSWHAWNISLPGGRDSVERLRLLLSARAGGSLGYGPVSAGFRALPGEPPSSETRFDDATIERAIRDVLAGN